MNPAIIYAIDAILAILMTKLRTDSDPLFVDLINRVKGVISDKRDPSPEDEAALGAFLAAERAKLHS